MYQTRFILKKKKKKRRKLPPKPPFPSCTVYFEWGLGERCFSQLSTLFEHFFCGSSAVLCVGTKQLSINVTSKHPI